MELVVFVGTLLLVAPAVAAFCAWVLYMRWAKVIFYFTLLPVVSFIIGAVRLSEHGEHDAWAGPLLVTPLVLGGSAIIGLFIYALCKWPKATNATAAFGWASMAYGGARKYQRMRDQEQAKALVDAMERHQKGH